MAVPRTYGEPEGNRKKINQRPRRADTDDMADEERKK